MSIQSTSVFGLLPTSSESLPQKPLFKHTAVVSEPTTAAGALNPSRPLGMSATQTIAGTPKQVTPKASVTAVGTPSGSLLLGNITFTEVLGANVSRELTLQIRGRNSTTKPPDVTTQVKLQQNQDWKNANWEGSSGAAVYVESTNAVGSSSSSGEIGVSVSAAAKYRLSPNGSSVQASVTATQARAFTGGDVTRLNLNTRINQGSFFAGVAAEVNTSGSAPASAYMGVSEQVGAVRAEARVTTALSGSGSSNPNPVFLQRPGDIGVGFAASWQF